MPVSTIEDPGPTGQIVWICVPDSNIRQVARTLGRSGEWRGKIVFHSSGVLSSAELRDLKQRGAGVVSVHPLMTFVEGVIPALSGVPFALEGDAKAIRIARGVVRDLDGQPFLISKQNKAAYHAWGAFASPLLIALLVTAELVARAAGIPEKDAREKMLPIIKQTIRNYEGTGPAGAFSGPIIRGDAATVKKHLRVLAKISGAREIYEALARSALRNLPTKNAKNLKKLLS